MTSTWSRGKQVLPFDPELNRTLHRTNDPHNPNFIRYGIKHQLPPPVDSHKQVIVENPDEGTLKRQHPASRPLEYYMGNVNIADLDKPLALPHLPQGHSSVVTSSSMYMFTARGLFS